MATMRDVFLEREKETLSPYAFLTANTRGRDNPYVPCDVRTEFQRDRDRIIHCLYQKGRARLSSWFR